MSRPGDRPLHRLPTLTHRKGALETCVFCPKLCRSACPVSDADPRETVTPWGKMSMAYFAANGSVELAPAFAAPAWACTGCMACRESCDHRNDVAATLYDARSALQGAGLSPAPAARVGEQFAQASRERLRALATPNAGFAEGDVREGSEASLVVGCAYARAPEAASDAIRVAARLVGGSVALSGVCCGAPLLYAGDRVGFVAQALAFASSVSSKKQVIVADAGCASTIRLHFAGAGVSVKPPVVHLLEVAARHLETFRRIDWKGRARWHDPCQLGRGLGVYEAPRVLLQRILGEPPAEFELSRERGGCSGAGGLLPSTMPNVAAEVARRRLAEHERLGGGTLVTGCASSRRIFEKQGAAPVDILGLLRSALA